MNRKIQSCRYLALVVLLGLILISVNPVDLRAQETTDGSMSFSVKTVTPNGTFSPRHVLAIWVEDANGFVLTRKLNGDKRKEYLYTWNSSSSGNVTDASTGATLSSHQTHTVSWDCRNLEGALVPDGDYKVCVEFTDAHVQGPYLEVPFNKGVDTLAITPADESNFEDINLAYEPVLQTGFAEGRAIQPESPKIFPNPTSGMLLISWNNQTSIRGLKLYNMKGALLHSEIVHADNFHVIDISAYPVGIYMIQLDGESGSYIHTVLKE